MALKKTLSFVLASLMVLLLCPISVLAGESLSELKGSGSETDPYLISDVEDLKTLRHVINDAEGDAGAGANKNNCAGLYFKLTADLDLKDQGDFFVPMSYWNGVFSGTFDGDGHTIKNCKIDHSSGYTLGFFSVTENAVIKNVTFENLFVYGYNNVGGVVGEAKNTRIENVTITGDSTVKAQSSNVGGIVGQAAGGTVVSGTVIEGTLNVSCMATSGYNMCVGGVVGWLSNATVDGVSIKGSVTAQTTQQGAAGVVGVASNNSYIKNVEISGTVLADAKTNTAGVVGQLENSASIDGVTITDTANITIQNSQADGLYTNNGGAAIVGCIWTGDHSLTNISSYGTVTIYGAGGDGNGFIVGQLHTGTTLVANVDIGGNTTFNCGFYNYGMLAGKIEGTATCDVINFKVNGRVVFVGGNNHGAYIGDSMTGSTAVFVDADYSDATFSKDVSPVAGASGTLTYVESSGIVYAGDNAVIIKDTQAKEELKTALEGMGITTVYAHTLAIKDGTAQSTSTASVFSSAKNLLEAVQKAAVDGDKVTVGGAITADDLDYESVKITVEFLQGEQSVKTIESTQGAVYTTITGYASANPTIAAAQEIYSAEGAVYLFALSVRGVPTGTYTVKVTVTGVLADGTEVCSQIYETSVTVD